MGSVVIRGFLRRAKYGVRRDSRVSGGLRLGFVSALRGENGVLSAGFRFLLRLSGKSGSAFRRNRWGFFGKALYEIVTTPALCGSTARGIRKKPAARGAAGLWGIGGSGGAPGPVQSFWSREVMLTFSSMAGRRLAMGRRSCCMVSRWRSVTVSSWSDWWSTVMQ